jgi:membrane protein implicated in regulation of membrane protease activity
MEMLWFWFWLVLAAALFVGEMLTLTFFLLPFGIGAVVAFVSTLLGADIWLQWVLFIVISLLVLILLRPAFKRLVSKAKDSKVGVDRLIGMTGVIIEGTSTSGAMRARVLMETWNANSETGESFAVDTPVKVLRVDGVHLIVERA